MISANQNYLLPRVSPILIGLMNSKKVKPALEEIAELRQLERFGPAKQRWRFLLENLSGDAKKEKQMALSQYANQQNWFDLGVDGSIIAKAFDYIQLRLPMLIAIIMILHLKSRPGIKQKPNRKPC